MNNNEQQQSGNLSPAESFNRLVLAFTEFVASIYSLPCELIVRKQIGKRYFTVAGLFGRYAVWVITFNLILVLEGLRNWTPSVSLGMRPQQIMLPPISDPVTSFMIMMRLMLLMGLAHKGSMHYRRMKKTEPSITTFTGYSRLEPIFAAVGYLRLDRLAINSEAAVKRWIEPAICYACAQWIVSPYIDEMAGTVLAWSAIAMAVRAHLIAVRQQWVIDDTQDLQIIWKAHLTQVSRRLGNAIGTDALVARAVNEKSTTGVKR